MLFQKKTFHPWGVFFTIRLKRFKRRVKRDPRLGVTWPEDADLELQLIFVTRPVFDPKSAVQRKDQPPEVRQKATVVGHVRWSGGWMWLLAEPPKYTNIFKPKVHWFSNWVIDEGK